MTDLSQDLSPLDLNASHARLQFSRRKTLDQAQFLYAEIATRMAEKLDYIRLEPAFILDAGCGEGANATELMTRYPEAKYLGVDHCPVFLDSAKQRFYRSWTDRLRARLTRRPLSLPEFIEGDLSNTDLPDESQSFIWSNLALHWHPEPHRVLSEWSRLLKTDGLLMFSCFGPASFQELRFAIESMKFSTQTPAFVDMHDFGDLLLERGFVDPVMDQERLCLSYETPQKLVQDVRALGGNPSVNRCQHLVGKQWLHSLYDALEAQRAPDGLIYLSLELAYGHAWKGSKRALSRGHEVSIPVSSISRRIKS